MGNLVTKGRVIREYEAEIMTLSITFYKDGADGGYILNGVQKQCEDFLAELEKINIPPENVRLEDGGIDRRRYDSEEIRAERKIIIKTKINIRLCTYIFSVIKKYSEAMRYSIHYSVDNKEQLSSQLLELAVEDSRRQADVIAKSLGKTVIGINSVNDKEYRIRNLAKSVCADDDINPEIPEAFKSDTPLADRASLPTVTLEEEIEICWNMSE